MKNKMQMNSNEKRQNIATVSTFLHFSSQDLKKKTLIDTVIISCIECKYLICLDLFEKMMTYEIYFHLPARDNLHVWINGEPIETTVIMHFLKIWLTIEIDNYL